MTKKLMVESFPRMDQERTNFMLALNDVLNGEVTWGTWRAESDLQGKYRVGVCRMDSPAGGLAIVTFRHPGQGDYTSVYDLERFSRDLRESYSTSNMPIIEALADAVRKVPAPVGKVA